MSAIYLDKICETLDGISEKNDVQSVTIYCPRGETSKVVGQKRRNIEKIYEKYGIKRVKVLEKNELLSYNIIIDFNLI